MRPILDDFVNGKDCHRPRYVTIVRYGNETGLKHNIISWALVDNDYEAHVWTSKKYRRKGMAPYTLGHLFQAIPESRKKHFKMCDDRADDLLCIGKYLYHNGLLRR